MPNIGEGIQMGVGMKQLGQWAALILAAAAPIAASATDDLSYGALLGTYVIPDGDRDAQYGAGAHLLFGLPVTGLASLEFNLHGYFEPHDSDPDLHDRAYGAGIDLLIGPHRWNTVPYGLVGFGALYEDIQLEDSVSAYANLGLGLIQKLTRGGLALRAEARGVLVLNEESIPGSTSLFDTRVQLGLQQSFGGGAPTVEAQSPDTAAKSVAAMDSDQDGILDSGDRCPQTPIGTPVDVNGCPPDADGDGVVDTNDRCPQSRAGAAVGRDGCVADADGDGVANDLDACPDTLPQCTVNERGCAIQQSVVLEQVNFEFNSSALEFNARTLLDELALCLKGQPGMQLEVSGHTDDVGSQEFNLKLSQRRAESVRGYLAERGVDEQRLVAEGYGEFQPIADNATEAGRELNRRVEVKVVSQ